MFTTTIEVTKVDPDDVTNDDLYSTCTVEPSLYADHIIKEEMVIGPTVLIKPNYTDQLEKSTKNYDDVNKENLDGSMDRNSISSKRNKTASHRSKDQFQKSTGYFNQASRRNVEENKIKRTVSSSHVKKIRSIQPKAKYVLRSQKTKITPNKSTAKVPSNLEFTCDYCQKVFDTKLKILKHMSYHNPKTIETCKICFKTFSFKSNLMRHMNDFHGEKTVFPCDLCDKEFGLKRYLALHKSAIHFHEKDTERKERKITCVCGKKFNDKSNYNRHKRCFCKVSSEINVVTCKFCLKEYYNEKRLNYHIKYIHTNNRKNRKYYCDYCNKCFVKKSALAAHIDWSHMKLALYVCEICGKCYSYAHSIARHLKNHSGRKPFSCQKCKKAFKTKHGFQGHKKTCTYDVNAKNTFTCDVCDQEFMLLRSFNRHNSRYHKISSP